MQVNINELVKNQIVTCQWSEDNSYYRAVVTEINKDQKKIRVRFIDYGNQSVEPLTKIRELPELVLKFPVMAHLVKLHGVPERKADVTDKNR